MHPHVAQNSGSPLGVEASGEGGITTGIRTPLAEGLVRPPGETLLGTLGGAKK